MKNGTVPTAETAELMTPGQFRDLASALVQLAPHNLPFARAQELIRNKSDWQERVRGALWGEKLATTASFEIERWERRYRDRFQLSLDTRHLVVPELATDLLVYPRLLVVDRKRLSLNRVFDAFDFPKWCYADDLGGAHKESQARPEAVYAVWVDGGVEPDDRFQNLSPDQLDEQGLVYETILERELHELAHHEETGGGHLDLVNWTITASRYSYGYAFCAYWSGKRFRVGYWRRGFAYPHGRPRQVVIVPS